MLIDTTSLMEAAGLKKQENRTLREKLQDAQLGTDDALTVVSSIAHYGENDAIKLRAAEMALKMNGDLAVDEQKVVPVVNIIIRDSTFGVNPILVPR